MIVIIAIFTFMVCKTLAGPFSAAIYVSISIWGSCFMLSMLIWNLDLFVNYLYAFNNPRLLIDPQWNRKIRIRFWKLVKINYLICPSVLLVDLL